MKPHLYFWQGRWWMTRNGPENWRRGLTLNDAECPSFAAACALARLFALPTIGLDEAGVLDAHWRSSEASS